ncbi:MAG: hypothetical protein DRQ55_15340 [Planctomycetota bacterium]|nr:MAG: hypothetical protein DRQ55_15340 [Planctomycetota bacterium]
MRRPAPATLLLLLAMALGPAVWLGKTLTSPEGDAFPSVRRGPKRADLVLVTVEGLGAAELRLHDPDQPPPPALDALAGRGLELLVAHAPGAAQPRAPLSGAASPAAPSPTGIVSLLTSRLPQDHGFNDLSTPPATPPATLLGAYAQAGFRCAAFSDVPLLHGLGLDRALERAQELPDADPAALARAAVDWLPADEADPGLALWVHLGPRPPGRAGAALDALDTVLAELLDALVATRRLERTWIVVAGSSGRGADTAVPMLMRLPRHYTAGEVRIGPCSTLDLAPTLLSYFGLEPLPHAVGRSWTGDTPDALFTGLGFAGTAPLERRGPGGAPVLGVRGLRALLTDEPGAYDLTRDPAAVHNLTGTPAGDAIAQELGAALEALERRRGG